MPKFLIKAARDRDAYIEWSTVVDDAVSVGSRADFATDPHVYPEERLKRTDKNGTSALHWADRPGPEQPGGWDDDGLIVDQRGLLPRAQFEAAFDHLNTTGEPIPDSMLVLVEENDYE